MDTLSTGNWKAKIQGKDTSIVEFGLYRKELNNWTEVDVKFAFDKDKVENASVRMEWLDSDLSKWILLGQYTAQGYTAVITGPKGEFEGHWDILGVVK